MSTNQLAATIKDMAVPGKGILAADESTPTIKKRLDSINVESTEENRRDYREMLFRTEGLGDFISGVILFEETLFQNAKDGTPFVDILNKQGIVPGIKVDKGVVALPGSPEEKLTQGADGLAERLQQYKDQGARFAKWRAVLPITANFPSCLSMHMNAEGLARYAAICQDNGIVPIVEPELLMDGDHSMQRCYDATEATLSCVFNALRANGVTLEHMILKPNMVVPGNTHQPQNSVAEVAAATIEVLRRTVPAAVPTINFLSGGQSDELATAHLNDMNKGVNNPWFVSYSYGRALQAPALKAWGGKAENVAAGQEALLKRARLNSAAALGEYTASMEA